MISELRMMNFLQFEEFGGIDKIVRGGRIGENCEEVRNLWILNTKKESYHNVFDL